MKQAIRVVYRAGRRRRRPSFSGFIFILGSACCLQIVSQPAESQEFTAHELTLGGSVTAIEAISDGRAVGWGTIREGPEETEVHAFLWTESGGMRDLGTLGGNRAEARAVDGDRVVGFSSTKNSEVHAFIWTPVRGMRDLGTLGGTYSAAFGVSGGQVVGESTTASGETHAFRWTAAGGMVDLGTLAEGTESSAVAVHKGLVAGWSATHDSDRPDLTRRPVAWTAAGQIVDIVGEPFDVREDGFVRGQGEAVDVRNGMVVGRILVNFEQGPCVNPRLQVCNPNHAFAWTAAGGMTDLGTLPGDDVSVAQATSGGQVVGSSAAAQDVSTPFSWTASGGMIDLGTLGFDAFGTDVSNGKVVGYFLGEDLDDEQPFLWTPEAGMVAVTPFRPARAIGIDEAGRIAVVQFESGFPNGRSAVLVFGGDADGDGVADAGDDCPDSIVQRKVVIDGCKTGAPNALLTNGCTVSDLVAECAGSARNHGKFVSCVSRLSKDLKKGGTITVKQKRAINMCAARSDLP